MDGPRFHSAARAPLQFRSRDCRWDIRKRRRYDDRRPRVNESLEALARGGNGLQTRNQIFDATGSLVGNSYYEVVLGLEVIINVPQRDLRIAGNLGQRRCRPASNGRGSTRNRSAFASWTSEAPSNGPPPGFNCLGKLVSQLTWCCIGIEAQRPTAV
jgi:hypothetical protein